ncbi:ATP-grasp domain-containing protein [Salinifilum aidingensis]
MNIAVIDPFSTGAALASELHRRGHGVVAVVSSRALPDGYAESIRTELYTSIIQHEELETTVQELSRHNVEAAVAGTEIGVELADRIAFRMGLVCNDPSTSVVRREKDAMAFAVERAGLRAPRSGTFTSLESMRSFLAEVGLPVVVKPINSAGSDGVFFCDTVAEAAEAFAALLGNNNQMRAVNEKVLVQEYLVGDQYYVNTVTVDGFHYVAEMWSDVRADVDGGRSVYEREDLLPPDDAVQNILRDYVLKVLDALDVTWGPAHTEVMMTPDGPVLIETAARMQGTIDSDVVVEAQGQSHVTLTADCYTNPGDILERSRSAYPYKEHMTVVNLIAPFDGMFSDGPATRTIRGLPTLRATIGEVNPGLPVERTVDLFTTPASLYLVAQDRSEIERDYTMIRQLEAESLYAR